MKSLHWLPVEERSMNKIACLCYHCYNSTARICCRIINHTSATIIPANTPYLFSNKLHTVRQYLVITPFPLLLLSVNSIPIDVRYAQLLSSVKKKKVKVTQNRLFVSAISPKNSCLWPSTIGFEPSTCWSRTECHPLHQHALVLSCSV